MALFSKAKNLANDMLISASLLSADYGNLKETISTLDTAGVDMIHLDIMDGSFVPSISFGQLYIKSLRQYSKLPFDTHLMINNPEKHIESFASAGSDLITVHAETCQHLDSTINLIKSFKVKAGIALAPTTSEECLKYIINKIDLVLVLSVNPGFGGQKFIDYSLNKIQNIRAMIDGSANKDIILSVDGGINDKTAQSIKTAGANALVSGSYLTNLIGNESELKRGIANLRC